MAHLHKSLQGSDVGVRFLHIGDQGVEDAVCPVFRGTRNTASPYCRVYDQPHWGVGDTASLTDGVEAGKTQTSDMISNQG